MDLGEKIKTIRKQQSVRLVDLSAQVGLSPSRLSAVENGDIKGLPSPELVNRIASFLNDESILHVYLENNPVYQAVVPRVFPELNNIKTDPVAVFTKMEEEIDEAKEAIKILKNAYGHVNPREVVPKFSETLVANMEQLIDVQRIIEAVQTEMLKEGLLTREERAEIYRRQQQKCLDRQYHKLELEVV